MKYRLKDITNRRSVDLNNHSRGIISGVKSIFPSATVNMYADYFEILNLPNTINDTDLRKMGQAIAQADSVLHGIAKEYNYTRSNGAPGRSIQLFERF